mmetsp:Transcript_1698/g.4113  ORF Transcript_1698/g.4113 Transcript_1698/m.4113 type:complete len:230 (+) Transcript_1698:391-1080(+)
MLRAAPNVAVAAPTQGWSARVIQSRNWLWTRAETLTNNHSSPALEIAFAVAAQPCPSHDQGRKASRSTTAGSSKTHRTANSSPTRKLSCHFWCDTSAFLGDARVGRTIVSSLSSSSPSPSKSESDSVPYQQSGSSALPTSFSDNSAPKMGAMLSTFDKASAADQRSFGLRANMFRKSSRKSSSFGFGGFCSRPLYSLSSSIGKVMMFFINASMLPLFWIFAGKCPKTIS